MEIGLCTVGQLALQPSSFLHPPAYPSILFLHPSGQWLQIKSILEIEFIL